MPLNCLCPHCRKMMAVGEEFASQAMRCPMCNNMFQAPPLPAAPPPPPRAPAPAASRPQPPAPPPRPSATAPGPVGDDWPWMSGAAAPAPPPPTAPVPGPGEYDWGRVKATVGLAPGWHMFLRGTALVTPSAILVFITLALCWLFLLIVRPTIDFRKIVMLIVLPLTLLGALTHLAGWAMCSLVPGDLRSRGPILGGIFSVAISIGLSTLAILIPPLLPRPDEVAPGVDAARLASYEGLASTTLVLAVLAGTGSGILLLMFLRGTALAFQNKRLTDQLRWFMIYFAAVPIAALVVYGTLSTIRLALGLKGVEQLMAYDLVLCLCQLALMAVTLAGFLLLVRDVRTTVERAGSPAKA